MYAAQTSILAKQSLISNVACVIYIKHGTAKKMVLRVKKIAHKSQTID